MINKVAIKNSTTTFFDANGNPNLNLYKFTLKMVAIF